MSDSEYVEGSYGEVLAELHGELQATTERLAESFVDSGTFVKMWTDVDGYTYVVPSRELVGLTELDDEPVRAHVAFEAMGELAESAGGEQ